MFYVETLHATSLHQGNESVTNHFNPFFAFLCLRNNFLPRRRAARGIAAEPPANAKRGRVMERIARREAAKLPKRLAQIVNVIIR
jgi:hypothetical protein